MDRIYLGIGCLKRPFDDQRQERIRREADAVASLVAQAESGRAVLICSPALLLENDANPREDRRLAASLWLNGAGLEVPHTEAVARRARELHALGFGVLDGLHLAYAEAAGTRWLVTCDDDLLRLSSRHRASLTVSVVDPCDLITEERKP